MTKSVISLTWFGVVMVFSVGALGAVPPVKAPPTPSMSTVQTPGSDATIQVKPKLQKSRRGIRQSTVPTKKSRRPTPRRSADVTPPRIDRLTPTPGIWIVDNIGVPEILIGFTEAVTVPVGAISVWTVGGGTVTNFTTAYDGVTNILTVSFASPIRDDRLTIVVDYSVTDSAGNELDGEIADPLSAVLPSGDGIRGGQAVFRINILQGDANRDGVVDAPGVPGGPDSIIIRDALVSVVGDDRFDSRADLNVDGVVNAQDVGIFRQAEGRTLPVTDGVRPAITAISPDPNTGLLDNLDTIRVTFSEIIAATRINELTCFLVDGTGAIHVPSFASQSIFGNAADYFFVPPLAQCDTYTINISNALADPSGELLAAPTVPPLVTGLIPPPAPTLNAHMTLTTATSVTITGSAPGATSVELSCPTGVFTIPLTNNAFTTDITLAPDSGNAIYFSALSACSGVRSPPVLTTVTHDTVPPEIFIDFPLDDAQITTATTDVAGRVGDVLSGFMGLTVTVNGNPAIVDVGIGNNGTFFIQNVPLGPIDQPTVITAVATDALGNTVSKQITATRVAIAASTSQMVVFSGNAQTAPVTVALSAPIAVQMTDTDGTTPFVNKVVTFKVTRSDGRLSSAPGFTCIGDGTMMLQCHTDSSGQAKAMWTMGSDAGCGNNRVEATSMSIEGTVAFCASATAATVSQLNIGSGNNQRAEAGGPAPKPLRVWVSDGQNPIVGQSVLFTVTRGGGQVNGQTTATVATDMTGHAEVSFTLGPDQGNNVVDAVVTSNPSLQPARFVTYGILRDETLPTSFTGIVLNNASQPIGGATCTLTIGATALMPVISDVRGRFAFDDLLMAGPAHLFVDGSTATTINGQPISPGTYPSLPFEPILIPNAANSLATPVLLPPLETTNGVVFDNTQDITLTLSGVEGLGMLVRSGAGTTVTKADGTVVDTANPITLILSQVHADDIPMPIPDGASPPFAWTLQPGGTHFDPPIEITYPNMSGLPAGSIAYFLSFDHALSRFGIVATGHVTDDGSQIISDPGAGLTVAGWGCNCPPYSVTGDCEYDECDGDPCCNDRCCDGDPCCDDPSGCCDSGDPCCGNPDRCCNPDNPCCGDPDPCCGSNDPCCGSNDRCCNPDNPCCGSDDPCCNPSGPCCGNPDPCCNSDNPCCAAAGRSAASETESSIASFAGTACCEEGSDNPCCNDPAPCCPCDAAGILCCGDHCCTDQCCGDGCCSASQTCCDGKCCSAEQTCCGGTDCCEPKRCCGNGECCPQDCEGCLDNGTLSGGMIDVLRDPVCVDEIITFTLSGVVDSGGIMRVDCTAKMSITAVTPTYKWTVNKPDGTQVKGSGEVATILANKVGTYTITYTAKAERDCPPSSITIGPKMAKATEVDLDVDSDNMNGITDADDLIEADPFSPDKPGKWGWVNNDDSDGDGFEDNQNNMIDGGGDFEDIGMLVVRSVDVSGLTDPKLLLQLGNTGVLRVFRATGAGATAILGPGLANPVDLIQELGAPGGFTLGMEGITPGTTTLTLMLQDGTTAMCSDTVRVTIIGLDVTWESAGANPQPISDPNNHPSGTLGFKVFPGATAPGSGFSDMVGVKVSTNPQVASVPVFLKALDPDDPSANNDVVDNDLLGGDNRDTNHQDTAELGSTQLVTDANGNATTAFRVAHQPGDNHRVAATIKQMTQGMPTLNMLNDNNVPPSNTNPATQDQVKFFIGNISDLLTVWRKLTVETDSMGAESFVQADREQDIEWTRFIAAPVSPTVPTPVQLNTPDIGLTTIRGFLIPNGNPCQSALQERWEGGAFIKGPPGSGAPSFLIVRNSCHLTSDGQLLTEFIIFGDPGDITGVTNTIHDDDLMPPVGGATQLPQTAVITSNIVTAYTDAYIVISDASDQLNPNRTVPWVSFLSSTALTIDYDFGVGVASSRDLTTELEFWTRNFVVCYQSGIGQEFDPDLYENGGGSQNVEIAAFAPYPVQNLPALPLPGSPVSGLTIAPLLFNSPALTTVYIETIRDKDVRPDTAKFWQYVAHEIGHKTFNANGSQGSESSEHAEGGLMSEGNDLQNIPVLTRFSAPTLARFRSVSKW